MRRISHYQYFRCELYVRRSTRKRRRRKPGVKLYQVRAYRGWGFYSRAPRVVFMKLSQPASAGTAVKNQRVRTRLFVLHRLHAHIRVWLATKRRLTRDGFTPKCGLAVAGGLKRGSNAISFSLAESARVHASLRYSKQRRVVIASAPSADATPHQRKGCGSQRKPAQAILRAVVRRLTSNADILFRPPRSVALTRCPRRPRSAQNSPDTSAAATP